MGKKLELTEENFLKEYETAINRNCKTILMLNSNVEQYQELSNPYVEAANALYSMRLLRKETLTKCHQLNQTNIEKIQKELISQNPIKQNAYKKKKKENVTSISDKDIDKLIAMGFTDVSYKSEKNATLYNATHDIKLNIYHTDPRDDYQGIYFDLSRDKEVLYESTGKNMISKIKKWIKKKSQE